MKRTITTHDSAVETGEHYENRIPTRLWAEDDLPCEKLLMKGSGSLSDAEPPVRSDLAPGTSGFFDALFYFFGNFVPDF